MRRTVRGALAALALALPSLAGAVDLKTSLGVEISVTSAPRLTVPLVGAPAGASGVAGGGLRYEVRDPEGTVHAGLVARTDRIPGSITATLAECPVTQEVFLVFAAPDAPDRRLLVTYWAGQGWAEPLALSVPPGQPSAPSLAFRAGGDAVLAWVHSSHGRLPSVLVRHFELTTTGEAVAHALLDVQDPAGLLLPVGAPVGLTAGVAAVLPDHLGSSAFLVLADPLRRAVGVVQLGLSRDNGGGFSAPPVPVNFNAGIGADGADPTMPIGSATGSGAVREPFRMDVLGAEGYYWVDDANVRAVAFRGGRPVTAVLAGERPATEAEAHVRAYLLLRAALSPPEPPAGGGRSLLLDLGLRRRAASR